MIFFIKLMEKKMKIKSLTVIIISSVISSVAMADDNCYVIGFHEPHTHTYDGLTFCNQSQLPRITVRGPLQLKNSVIHDDVNVSGPIDASHSEMGSIQINKQFTSQKVVLKNHSKVHGNIVFEGLSGVVFKSVDSEIAGKVVNGYLKEIKN